LKEYVLVVDDEQSLRQVLELFFKKEGFEVDTASFRLALTYRHRSRRWTIEGLDEAPKAA